MSTKIEYSKDTKFSINPPSQYQVIMHNDDYTTTDFVVEVLRRFFSMSIEKATTLMLKVHHDGRAICGVYPRDIALTKANQVIDYARQHDFPLRCTCEPVNE